MADLSQPRPTAGTTSWKRILIPLIPCVVFCLGMLPTVFLAYLFFYFFSWSTIWHYLVIPIALYLGMVILFLSELFISAGCIKLFKLTYAPGVYTYTLRDKNAFHWVVVCVLYTPMRMLLEMFPMGRIKNIYLRLLGMKIGKNTLVGGVIKDPCLTEFGDNTTMGEYAIIYGHIHNTEHGTITMNKVKVGSCCVIGAGAIVMPGAVIQDNVTVAAGAVVTQNQVLESGKMYGGVPAKEICKKEPTNT
ncbi:MAG: DapH/DapD/GlmU-related protein [Candidatus Thermoplasmatota archaeon]